MPWRSGAAYAAAHDKKLNGAAADKARDIATAMIARGVPEGEAIATANQRGDAMLRRRRLYPHARSPA